MENNFNFNQFNNMNNMNNFDFGFSEDNPGKKLPQNKN